jgi:hypothetical protein
VTFTRQFHSTLKYRLEDFMKPIITVIECLVCHIGVGALKP